MCITFVNPYYPTTNTNLQGSGSICLCEPWNHPAHGPYHHLSGEGEHDFWEKAAMGALPETG